MDIVRLSSFSTLMMLVSAFVGTVLLRTGYPNAGIDLFIACLGFYVLLLVCDVRNPRLRAQRGPQTESITAINGLPLPPDLIALIESGRWKCPTDLSGVDRLFPDERGKFTLYALDRMAIENRFWTVRTEPLFLGEQDTQSPPGDIDPKLSVLIGDLGLGCDQPIALDYRASMGEPRVLTLNWSKERQEIRWVEIAPNIRTFAASIGL